jgi:phage terminase large subunit GpA-like protein
MAENEIYIDVLSDVLEDSRHRISNILPSEWVEKNRVMSRELTSIPGKFSYENTPYLREVVDCLSPDHPARKVAVIKGAQIGYSSGVIESGIGWIISENPGNILFLVGHESLVKDSMNKVDSMIDSCGIRNLIRSSTQRARNTKSGDTDNLKEFPGGYLKLGITNHKMLRNISMMYGFIDDFESMKGATKESGATTKMIEQRFASYAKKMKLFYISTPELKETSNIEPEYLKGDQRKFNIPCPCCGEYIPLEWETTVEKTSEAAGITWKTDENNELIPESVGYTCQKCGGFFTDSNKMEWLNKGVWIPTAKASQPGYYSYHISALYAPVFMYDWEHYVRQYLECNPVGGKRLEEDYKTFVNLVLGETYEHTGESISANELQENIRDYEIGIVPETLSEKDGNGKIVLITCGIDLNGKEDDARLDYEIRAYSETGARYVLTHGSIGTFQRFGAERYKDRKKYTYRHGEPNSVWPYLDEILSSPIKTDNGKRMKIFCTGLDVGYMDGYAWQFIDETSNLVFGLKGVDEKKYVNVYADKKSYRKSKSNPGKLFLVEVNYVKDNMARHMALKWSSQSEEGQPPGFMNFPMPGDGKFLYKNYFSHFEAEHKTLDKLNRFLWQKKSPRHENHLYDCALYADTTKDIWIDMVFLELGIKNGTWSDYVKTVIKK